MHASTSPERPSVQEWRNFCEAHAPHFLPIRGTAAARSRVEQWEERLIEQLQRDHAPLHERAVALRTIVALRGCTMRDAAQFFNIEPRVVVASMSLLELPHENAVEAGSIARKTKAA